MKKLVDGAIKWLVCIYLILLPWIVMPYKAYYSVDERLLFSPLTDGSYDLFLYGKMLFTITFAIILLILMLFNRICYGSRILDFNRREDVIVGVILGIYTVCTIMSYILAQYKSLALSGGVNSFEGTYILLSYVILFLAGRKAFSQKLFRYAALIQTAILCVLMVIENMYMPVTEIILGRTADAGYGNRLSLTFYNPSYCAAYIIILITICLYFFYKAVSWQERILWCSCFLINLAGCILTKSTAALYIATVEIILSMVIMCVHDKKPICIGMFLIGMMIISGIVSMSGTDITELIKSTSVNETTAVHTPDYYKIEDIRLEDGKVFIQGADNGLCCYINDLGAINFVSDDEKIIDISVLDNVMHFPEEYHGLSAYIENNALNIDAGYKGKIRFLIRNNEFVPMAIDGTVIKDISSSASVKTCGFDKIITGRGYIWRNSIPILKNTVIFGHGAGTFEMYFKQFDYVGLLNSQGNVDLVIDKPHSWYIQMACSQGVLCCATVAVGMILLIIRIIKDCIVKKTAADWLYAVMLITGFGVYELITDSSITVNPVFVTMLGVISGNLLTNRE